jgi:sodium-dependent dicarboxylate transporter 2/3/5
MSVGMEAVPEEALTGGESQFERRLRTIGLVTGPLVSLAVWLATLSLEPHQQRLAAILSLVVVLWVTEALPIPVTAVLGLCLCVVFQVPVLKEGEDAGRIVFGSFSSPTIFLALGGFILARAMTLHGLDRRFALRMLTVPGVSRSTYRVLVAFGAVAALISSIISNSAATAMLLPIGVGLVRSLGPDISVASGRRFNPRRSRFAAGVMLMIAYGASIGGLLTPIGSPTNLVGLGFLEKQGGREINFLQWTAMAAPIVAVMFVALCLVVIGLNRPEAGRLGDVHADLSEQRRALGPLSRGERNTLIAFTVALTGWVGPSVVSLVLGQDSPISAAVSDRMDEGAVAFLAAALLFILPVDWKTRQFTMTWEQAVRIDWGTLLLVGAGIAFGGMVSSTGLAKVVGSSIANNLGVSSVLSITVLAAVIGVLLSETTSNTATVGIVVPITIPIALAAGVDPIIPVLGAVFGSSYGFMLPVSTPPNAIVYGSGMIPITRMFHTGFAFDLIGVVLVVAGVLLMANLTGIA